MNTLTAAKAAAEFNIGRNTFYKLLVKWGLATRTPQGHYLAAKYYQQEGYIHTDLGGREVDTPTGHRNFHTSTLHITGKGMSLIQHKLQQEQAA